MNKFAKYPEGVFAMFFMQMFSMVGFAMLFSLLTLYSVHVLHFTDQRAYDISDAFNAQVFAMSALGGFLANRFLGYRIAFIFSATLAILGLGFLLSKNITAFYLGLGMYVVAQGIMVPSMFVLLGRLYEENDPRRDSGFIISYVGMNVGAFFASLFSGPISQYYGYWQAFLVGLVFAVLTLINYLMYQYKFKPKHFDKVTREHAASISTSSKWIGFGIALLLIPLVAELMNHAQLSNLILTCLGITGVIIIVTIALQQPEVEARNKLFTFLILTLVSLAFGTLYLLGPTVLPIFTERNVDRHLFSLLIPTASFSSLNPFFIVTLGPILSYLWIKLGKKNRDLSIPAKFASGLVMMGLGYLVLVVGIYFHTALGLVLMFWLVIGYFFQTMAELFINPIGFSMVGNLAPKQHEGLMMGLWQLASGVAGVFTDHLSKMIQVSDKATPMSTNPFYAHMFLLCGGVTAAIGLLTFTLVPWLKKIMQHHRKVSHGH